MYICTDNAKRLTPTPGPSPREGSREVKDCRDGSAFPSERDKRKGLRPGREAEEVFPHLSPLHSLHEQGGPRWVLEGLEAEEVSSYLSPLTSHL